MISEIYIKMEKTVNQNEFDSSLITERLAALQTSTGRGFQNLTTLMALEAELISKNYN